MSKITKNIISRDEALKLAPDYVAFMEDRYGPNELFDKVFNVFDKLKRGQKAITFIDGQYVVGKISSVNHNDFRAVDGPIVRFMNDEASWRVDGDSYAFPLPAGS